MFGREPVESSRAWKAALRLHLEAHRLQAVFPAEEKGGLAAMIKRAAQQAALKVADAAGHGNEQAAIAALEQAHGLLRDLMAAALIARSTGALRPLHVRRLRTLVERVRHHLDQELDTRRSAIEDRAAAEAEAQQRAELAQLEAARQAAEAARATAAAQRRAAARRVVVHAVSPRQHAA